MLPFITVFGKPVPLYGAMILLGLCVSSALSLNRVRRFRLSRRRALLMLTGAVGTGFLGARGLFQLISPSEGAGLVFYGGLLGAFPGAYLAARLTKTRMERYLRPMLPCLPLGHAFGRIGCLLGGCCWGVPTDMPVAVVYERGGAAPQHVPLFPVQALEALLLLGIFAGMVIYARRPRPGRRIAGLYAVLYGICRFATEFLRGDAQRGFLGPLSIAQWISLALALAGSIALIYGRKGRLDHGNDHSTGKNVGLRQNRRDHDAGAEPSCRSASGHLQKG